MNAESISEYRAPKTSKSSTAEAAIADAIRSLGPIFFLDSLQVCSDLERKALAMLADLVAIPDDAATERRWRAVFGAFSEAFEARDALALAAILVTQERKP